MPTTDYSNEVHLSRSKSVRIVYLSLGTVAVGLGILGIILPVMPGTPFLLIAAACYARGSARFYNWLLNNRLVGPLIRDWRQSRTMPLQAKVSAIGLIVVAFGVTIAFVLENTWARVGMVLLALGIITFLIRVPTRSPGSA